MRRIWTVALLLLAAGPIWGADKAAPLPASKTVADEDDVRDRLGERFTSQGRGISFRPPIGGAQIKRTPIGADIVRYTSADEKWSFNVSMLTFEKPAKLLSVDDPRTPEDESKTKPGILQQIVQQLGQNNIATEILRQDVVNVGKNDVGMLVARYTQGGATGWAAQRVRAEFPEFGAAAALHGDDPLLFTGEMIYRWMFENDPVLRPLRRAADVLAERDSWPRLYDIPRLQGNDVPAAAAIYYHDMYVPREYSERTAATIRGLRAWVTSEYQHDGLRVSSGQVLDRLIAMARGNA